jgi:hypothetical protein
MLDSRKVKTTETKQISGCLEQIGAGDHKEMREPEVLYLHRADDYKTGCLCPVSSKRGNFGLCKLPFTFSKKDKK